MPGGLKKGTGSQVCMHSHRFAQTASPKKQSNYVADFSNRFVGPAHPRGQPESDSQTNLFPTEFNLEVFSRLLSDPSTKVQLIDLTVFIPHRSFVGHYKLTPPRYYWIWLNIVNFFLSQLKRSQEQ